MEVDSELGSAESGEPIGDQAVGSCAGDSISTGGVGSTIKEAVCAAVGVWFGGQECGNGDGVLKYLMNTAYIVRVLCSRSQLATSAVLVKSYLGMQQE
jgi:hypothetical protein